MKKLRNPAPPRALLCLVDGQGDATLDLVDFEDFFDFEDFIDFEDFEDFAGSLEREEDLDLRGGEALAFGELDFFLSFILAGSS